MDDNFLTKDFIDPKSAHIAIVAIMVTLALAIMGLAIRQGVDVHQTLNSKGIKSSLKTHGPLLEVGSLRLTAMDAQGGDRITKTSSNIYVTLLNLDSSAPKSQRQATMENLESKNIPIFGLSGDPSFIINPSDFSFWRWQFYIQITFTWGGFIILYVLMIIGLNLKYRYQKIFVTSFKNVILSMGLLFIGGALLKWVHNIYLINFLKTHYESVNLSAPIPTMLFYIGIATLVSGFFLEDGVALQKEQDLTI
jgi:hypothetical protein